jgi:hypothetical protein
MISGFLARSATPYSGYSGGTVTDLHRVPFIELSLYVPASTGAANYHIQGQKNNPENEGFFFLRMGWG